MKKIVIFGLLVFFNCSGLLAQDNTAETLDNAFKDCFYNETEKAKNEGLIFQKATRYAEKICKIKVKKANQTFMSFGVGGTQEDPFYNYKIGMNFGLNENHYYDVRGYAQYGYTVFKKPSYYNFNVPSNHFRAPPSDVKIGVRTRSIGLDYIYKGLTIGASLGRADFIDKSVSGSSCNEKVSNGQTYCSSYRRITKNDKVQFTGLNIGYAFFYKKNFNISLTYFTIIFSEKLSYYTEDGEEYINSSGNVASRRRGGGVEANRLRGFSLDFIFSF